METSDLLLWGGIGVVAYYVLFANTSTAAPAVAATATTPAVPQTPAAASTASAPTEAQITLATLQAMGNAPVLVAAQQSGSLPANGMLTASQWNWYLQQVSGIPGMSLATYLSTPNPVSIQTWWAALMLAAQQAALQSQAAAITPASSVAGLGRVPGKQPGQGINSNFPAPGNNEDGRFDFENMGWN